jgi:histidinol-phosphate aminotransferase
MLVPPSPALPDATPGLRLVKPAVRSQTGYRLAPLQAARKLNQNENPDDFPSDLKRLTLERLAALHWQRYPDFTPASLQAELAAHHSWVPDGVLVGNGSNELIQATLTVFLGAGDAVVAPTPTFALYGLLTSVLGGRYVPVPLGDRFAYDPERLIEVARREQARVLVLNSPNNPTGSALPEGAVERVLAETDALVLCDEAYQDFGGPSAVALLAQSSRVVVLRTFSKAFGMAGLRFGYALAHPEVAQEIAKAKLPYNVNALTLTAASVAAEHRERFAVRTAAIRQQRDRLAARLAEMSGLTVFPSAANFVLVRFDRVPVRVVFERLLSEFGILVRDVSAGPGLAECLRISIGTREDVDAVIAALQEILATETVNSER